MARNALLIWFSVVLCLALPALAQHDSPEDDSRKPDQLIRMLAKLHRLLRQGGRVVNIDRSATVPEPQAVQEFTAAGFHITKTVSFLPLEYFQVFE